MSSTAWAAFFASSNADQVSGLKSEAVLELASASCFSSSVLSVFNPAIAALSFSLMWSTSLCFAAGLFVTFSASANTFWRFAQDASL